MNKRHHRSTLAAALAVVGLLAAGCSAEEPGSQPERAETTEAPEADTAPTTASAEAESEATESDEADTVRVPSQAESFVALSETAFTVDHAPNGEHGLEVSVSFNVHRQAINNEGNVIRAISHAVDEHPDYDLIVVRGYSDTEMTDGDARLIDAWYKPEHVEQMDLEEPDAERAYDHCYSCTVNAQYQG